MTVLLGGRVAEAIVFGAVTTGAANDLQRVAEITHAMVHDYGMGTATAGVRAVTDADIVSDLTRRIPRRGAAGAGVRGPARRLRPHLGAPGEARGARRRAAGARDARPRGDRCDHGRRRAGAPAAAPGRPGARQGPYRGGHQAAAEHPAARGGLTRAPRALSVSPAARSGSTMPPACAPARRGSAPGAAARGMRRRWREGQQQRPGGRQRQRRAVELGGHPRGARDVEEPEADRALAVQDDRREGPRGRQRARGGPGG